MATNFDRALYQAPQGIETLEAEPIEIEIEDPESVSIAMDGIEIEIDPAKRRQKILMPT